MPLTVRPKSGEGRGRNDAWASKTPWIKVKMPALCRRVEGATMNDKIATAFLMALAGALVVGIL
jgi:hypothetical protein